jgi:hypothetical protein
MTNKQGEAQSFMEKKKEEAKKKQADKAEKSRQNLDNNPFGKTKR